MGDEGLADFGDAVQLFDGQPVEHGGTVRIVYRMWIGLTAGQQLFQPLQSCLIAACRQLLTEVSIGVEPFVVTIFQIGECVGEIIGGLQDEGQRIAPAGRAGVVLDRFIDVALTVKIAVLLSQQGALSLWLLQFLFLFAGAAWIFEDRIEHAAGQMHAFAGAEAMQTGHDAQ